MDGFRLRKQNKKYDYNSVGKKMNSVGDNLKKKRNIQSQFYVPR